MELILLLISFFASVAGAICGIGGGVIIKPVLDTFNVAGVATISFLSGCTVLSMSCYSVAKSVLAKENLVNFQTGTPLALGAAVGGVAGKYLFSALRQLSPQPERVGGYQAVCLAVLTLGTLFYTLMQKKITTHRIHNPLACVGIGLCLGVFSSFLGIGGGPINLVVLYFFFSMSTKTAAQNSLYIILISQAASLVTTLLTASVPQFAWPWLLIMVAGGILGGIAGHKVNRHLSAGQVNRLFIGLMGLIVLISCCNAVRFLGA